MLLSTNMKYELLLLNVERIPTYIFDNLGQHSIASYLETKGFKAMVYSGIVGECKRIVSEAIEKDGVPIIGFYAATDNLSVVSHVIKWIKTTYNVYTIVGGPQAVDLKEQFLHDTNCDFVIEGEGEEPIYQLLSSLIDELCSLKDVQSLRYIDQNGIYCENTLAKPFCNLDEIPFPSKKRCIDGRFRNDNSFGIITGRGCPFNCAFCYEGANTKQVRLRTIDNVMSEIDFALSENKNLKYLNIYDDTFTLDFKRVSEFCDKIKSRNLLWYCEGHTSNIVNNPEIIEKMVESGMIGLQIGIESGSEKVLKAYNKQTNPDMLIKVVEICKNAGLTRLVGNFIVGGAFETERTIYKSMELAKQMLTTGKGMFECKTVFLAPYPHTSITLNPQNYDLEYHKENELTCAYSMHMPLMTPKTMKYDKLIELKLKFDNMIETTIKELSLFPDKLDVERNFFKSGKRLTANSKWRNNYLEQEHIVNYLEACFSINGQVEKRYTDNEILEMYPLRTFNLLQYENEKLIYGEYRFEYESAYLLKYSAGKLKLKEIILNSPYRSEDMLKAYHALNNKCLIYISEF